MSSTNSISSLSSLHKRTSFLPVSILLDTLQTRARRADPRRHNIEAIQELCCTILYAALCTIARKCDENVRHRSGDASLSIVCSFPLLNNATQLTTGLVCVLAWCWDDKRPAAGRPAKSAKVHLYLRATNIQSCGVTEKYLLF